MFRIGNERVTSALKHLGGISIACSLPDTVPKFKLAASAHARVLPKTTRSRPLF